jgi:hypothetical protein
MKIRRSGDTSPFATTIYLDRSEIDDMCETALRDGKHLPPDPKPIAIDSFIESYFRCTVDFGTDLGEDVMGFTLFDPKGAPKVVGVSPRLDDGSKVGERRIRATLAHEGGHCLIHPVLFLPDVDKRSLFGTNIDLANRRILCRTQDMKEARRRFDGRWWEYQANCAIGGFLLPQNLFRRAVDPFLEATGGLGLKTLSETNRLKATRSLAEIFDVNPKVVEIRLGLLFPSSGSQQEL